MNFKVNFMNPNNKAALVDATSTLKKLQLSLFKDLLKLDFNRFKYNRNLLKELNKIFPLLSKCRNDCISKK